MFIEHGLQAAGVGALMNETKFLPSRSSHVSQRVSVLRHHPSVCAGLTLGTWQRRELVCATTQEGRN